MAINQRLKLYLDQHGVAYHTMPHLEVFTAQEVAAAAHVAGGHVAKVVLVRDSSGDYLMSVLPAPCRLDLDRLAAASGRTGLMLATEEEIARLFPDCELGAMPPFGNLYRMPVYLGACAPHEGSFIFEAGTHHEVVSMRSEDYERLVRPIVSEICTHVHAHVERKRMDPL